MLKRQVETNATPESNQAKSEDAPDFREALSRPVRTKVLTEEERKLQRAEQKDFRANLVRKVGELTALCIYVFKNCVWKDCKMHDFCDWMSNK